ncbi:MAG: hypothetical protein KAX80_00350, partial [Planctomycetes bacterium]|nr:hypothetical protein [Planctomycetota bacterium]
DLKVVVTLLPDSSRCGMLEDLCLESISDDPAFACVDAYFECTRRNGIPHPRNMSKAKVHAFLASRRNPSLRLGEAAGAGCWPWDSPVFDEVKQFLQMVAS